MIELSIVTGTYNRIHHLQNMITSVRDSIGTGIPYEIVLVDGGSTDGTIEWAKQQPNVVLIEQGELLGAIKAFNTGLYAARGKYCVIGNDDVTYMGETLLRALSFMHDNPDVGVGCFYQDRDHPGTFNLSYMPAVLNGKQVQHVYGQVCIVPKWLGDKVGWWGAFDNQYTYGGDNNLSCFVLEAGYRVTGIPCACIHDVQVNDALRHENNGKMMVSRRSHPDSEAWGKNWTHRDGTCGPIIRGYADREDIRVESKRLRVLYLPIYEQGHEIQKSQKRGLRDALAKQGLVYEYDWCSVKAQRGGKYMMDYLWDICDAWKPHLILSQIHTPEATDFNAHSIVEMRKDFPDMAWVNWNGDYHRQDLLSTQNMQMCKQFDLQCVVTTAVRDEYSKHGIGWMYWQIGYENATPSDAKTHDIVFLASGYSRERIQLAKMLRSLGANVGIYGSWGSGIHVDGNTLYNFDAGAGIYANAKLSIGDNQWGNKAVGFVSNRLFQAMAAGGALYMQQYVPDIDKLLGLEDGVHYIVWKDLNHLKELIGYWLAPENEDQRRAIADAGAKFVREHHSFDVRVAELFEVVL